jgi:hypothetical protein
MSWNQEHTTGITQVSEIQFETVELEKYNRQTVS